MVVPAGGVGRFSSVVLDKILAGKAVYVRPFIDENIPWREAQESGLLMAPLRKPHENAIDPHWIARKSVSDVEHPEVTRPPPPPDPNGASAAAAPPPAEPPKVLGGLFSRSQPPADPEGLPLHFVRLE